MRELFPVIFSMISLSILSTVEIALLRLLHRDWWNRAWIRRTSLGLPALGLTGLVLWASGVMGGVRVLVEVGAYITTLVFVVGIALMLSLPLSGTAHVLTDFAAWVRRTIRAQRPAPAPVQHAQAAPGGRRAFLKTTAAVFPALAIAGGGAGLVGGQRHPLLREVPMVFPALPAALDGFRIAHISDTHLGLFLHLEDFEEMLAAVAARRPDMLLLTGDIADDASIYAQTLDLAAQLRPPHGTFASIGNHEYFSDIQTILRAYERGPVPLLLDSGAAVDVGQQRIWLAGLDDPRSMRNTSTVFFQRSMDGAMRDATSDAFTIVLSHRPKGFLTSAQLGLPLTLAGHTHGGQIGFNGRSVVGALSPEQFLWGGYEKGPSKLYVSAGAGHWFPYRLGCPAEIPIYTLRAAPQA